jgi:poly-gamma-glutamate capsule biosynthesis protein CapA/YwtB (metallophosphatase superfamily)
MAVLLSQPTAQQAGPPPNIRLFLCGDMMIGRGIDQVLAHPCDRALHEECVDWAIGYIQLAEAANGPIPRRADPSYVWGSALDELLRATDTHMQREGDGLTLRRSNRAAAGSAAQDVGAPANARLGQ